MQALVYHGPRDVRIDDKPKPKIVDREDIVLKVTKTAICGSDLHLYHGKVEGMEPGQTLGHEFMGIVEEVGQSVHEVKKGDRIVVPFNIDCGECWYCRHGLWSQCSRSNPKGEIGAAYGYSQALGGYDGGQAEYVRVPFGNFNQLKIPDGLDDDKILMLSDVFPTGFYGTDIASIHPDVRGIQPGDDVAVFGAGPVGYFATLSALKLRGAAKVFSIDHFQNRLEKTKALGAATINFDEEDPVEVIKEATNGDGAICIDAVGFEAVGHHAHGSVKDPSWEPKNPMQIFEWVIKCARKNSVFGIPGVYAQSYDVPLGKLFQRGIQIRMGQCPVKKYNERLLHLVETGRVDPSQLVSTHMKLDEAPKAYEIWDRRNEATKIVLSP